MKSNLLQQKQPVGGLGAVETFQAGGEATNAQLCDHLANMGAIDTGALGTIRDVRQHSLSMQLATAIIGKRNDDLRNLLDNF